MLITTSSFNEFINIGDVKPNEIKRNKQSKNLSVKAIEKLQFLTPSIKKIFNRLR